MKHLRQEFLAALGERLRDCGFRKRRQEFVKDGQGVRQAVHISFINHVDDFDITVDVAVRHHKIEDEMNAERPYLKDSERKATYTVGAELGNIKGTGQRRWTVRVATDITTVVEDIFAELTVVGLPFLDRFSSLEEVRRVLKNGQSEAGLICPVFQTREKLERILGLRRSDAS